MTISPASTKTWIARLFAVLRAVGAPDVLKMLFASMVVTKQPPQLVATNAIVNGQEQRALFRWSAAQNRRNARGQFGYRDLLIRQGHLTVLRDPVPFRGREDGAR